MPSALNKIPVELRLEIWYPLVAGTFASKGKIPAIIKALRAEPTLYHEALEVFYKHNAYVLHWKNDWSFLDMGQTAILRITKLEIRIM